MAVSFGTLWRRSGQAEVDRQKGDNGTYPSRPGCHSLVESLISQEQDA
jgi:hypothetical protein